MKCHLSDFAQSFYALRYFTFLHGNIGKNVPRRNTEKKKDMWLGTNSENRMIHRACSNTSNRKIHRACSNVKYLVLE